MKQKLSIYLYTPEGVPKSKVVFQKFLKCYKNSGKGLQEVAEALRKKGMSEAEIAEVTGLPEKKETMK